MVKYMKSVSKGDQELSVEERNLLSVAYKNVIGARRASWRVLSSIEAKEKMKGDEGKVSKVSAYRKKVEDELDDVCDEILGIIKDNLIPQAEKMKPADKAESQVFYFKMSGDYHRYLAEFKLDEMRRDCAESALDSYKQAQTIAEDPEEGLPPYVECGLSLVVLICCCGGELLIANPPTSRPECHVFPSTPQDAPDPPGLGTQPQRLLLRDSVGAGAGVRPGQEGLRLRHRRVGLSARGVVQGCHAHHAAPARQPHAVDQRRRGEGRPVNSTFFPKKYMKKSHSLRCHLQLQNSAAVRQAAVQCSPCTCTCILIVQSQEESQEESVSRASL